MSTPWIRRPPDGKESGAALIVAGVAAVGVGVVTFYLTRLLLARDALGGSGLPVETSDGVDAESDAAAERVRGA